MNERFPWKRAYVLVLAVLLRSFSSSCRGFDVFDDAYSPSDVGNNFAEDRRADLDSSIVRIFQSSKENSKRTLPEVSDKISRRSSRDEKSARAKRESPSKGGDRKNPKEGSKAAEKRSAVGKATGESARAGRESSKRAERSSRAAAKPRAVGDKLSDYDASSENGSPEYEEIEDEIAGGSNRRSNEFERTENRFSDQDERSMLYDDFETKDVAKRGVAEDYEELRDEVDDPEDGSELRGSSEEEQEEPGRRKVRGNVAGSMKRDVSATSKDKFNGERAVDEDRTDGKDSRSLSEVRPDGAEKEAEANGDRRRSLAVRTDRSKRNVVAGERSSSTDDRSPIGGSSATESGKTKEESAVVAPSSTDEKTAEEPPDPNGGAANLDEAKADVAKIETLAGNAVETGSSEEAGKPREFGSDAATGEQPDTDYEKRAEEQIQRKIDSIKEEIKREIAESEKLKEIESNNAKFDEILDQEEDEEEEAAAAAAAGEERAAVDATAAGKKENPAKRSATSFERQSREKPGNDGERSIERKKRQNEGSREKVEKKSTRENGVGKRSAAPSQPARSSNASPLKKRDVPRNAYLVRRDPGNGRKRRRSRDSERENSRERLKSRSPEPVQEERALAAELASPLDGKSNSVASLTGNAEELGPLASEYGEAFGGLQGAPGDALARFKRIKRVLRPRAWNGRSENRGVRRTRRNLERSDRI